MRSPLRITGGRDFTRRGVSDASARLHPIAGDYSHNDSNEGSA